MAVFVVVVLVMAVFVVVVLVVVIFWESHVVATVIAVEFLSVFSVLGKHMNVSGCGFGHRTAEFVNQYCFEIKGCFSGRHGVCTGRDRTVGVHVRKSAFNPRFQSKPVIEEHIGLIEADEVRSRGLVVVNRDVYGAHHLNTDQIATDGRGQLFNVVSRGDDGAQCLGVLISDIVSPNTACEATENHHQACNQCAFILSAHAFPLGINYLIETNN